jgi:DNA repair protein RadC
LHQTKKTSRIFTAIANVCASSCKTRAIVNACATVGIAVHDHIIIGHGEATSFKTLGLL